MANFIPPYPHRPAKDLGPLDTVKYARRDLLSIWPETIFSQQFSSTKIINLWVFIANSPERVKHVLDTQSAKYEAKSTLLRKALEPLLGEGINVCDGSIWQSLWLDPQQAQYFDDIVYAATQAQIQQWSALKPGAKIKVLPEMRQLGAGIISRCLFGKGITDKQVNELVESFSAYQAAIEQMGIVSFLGVANWLPSFGASKVQQSAQRIHRLLDVLLAEGRNNSDPSCIMALLLARQGETLSAGQIRNELILLFMAAYEIIANTLSWAWYLVSQCTETEQKLYQEAASLMADPSARVTDADNLPFSHAIIKETLRLYPPMPILLREAKVDDKIGKRDIPTGSIMLVVPWLLHRHKLYWQNPDHFMPERFLPDAPAIQAFSYLPFNAGAREPLAQFFGGSVTAICLSALSSQFRLQLPKGEKVGHECRITLRPQSDLTLQILAR